MIHFCTCTGRSASNLEQTRKQEVASSCKICGHKPLVYERGALSGSMLSTVGLELTRVIDPALNWKTLSKSNKRATRRARTSMTVSNKIKAVEVSLKGSEDLIDKDSKRVEDMPVSESEKLGVSILGRRFSDTVENVPIKKRKFPLVRSPSPPPRTPPRPEESERLLKSQSTSSRKKPTLNSNAEQQATTFIPEVYTVLGQAENAKMVFDGKDNLTETNVKHGDRADFSGISILAAAACSSTNDCSASNLDEPALNDLMVAGEGSSRNLQNTKSSSMPEQLSETHLQNHSVLDSKTDLNICIETHVEKNILSGTSKDYQKVLESNNEWSSRNMQNTESSSMPEELSEKHLHNHSVLDGKTDLNICIETCVEKNISLGTSKDHGKVLESSNGRAVSFISEKSMDIVQNLPAKENKTLPSVETSSLWDDRSQWDLNIVMDAWGSPCDDPIMDAKPHTSFGIDDNGMQKEKVTNLEHCQVPLELGDAKDHIETSVQHIGGGTVMIDGHDGCVSSTMQETPLISSDSSVADIVANKDDITCLSIPGIRESNEEKHHLDACNGLDSITCSQEKIPCEIVNAPNRTSDVSEETKPLHYQEQIRFNADSTAAPVECEPETASHNKCVVAEKEVAVQGASFDSEREGEIIPYNLVVSGDTSGDQTSHLHEPHGAGCITDNSDSEGKTGIALVVDSDKPLKDQHMSDAEGGKASRSRSPSPGGDHMTINTVSEDSKLSSAVVALGNQSGYQCMADVQRTEASCSRSPQFEERVACLSIDQGKHSCQINDLLTFGHDATLTSSLLVDGNISMATTVDGNAIDQSKTGDSSSCHSDSVQESLNYEALPAAGTSSQGDELVADMNEQDGKTSMVVDEDMNDIEMSTDVHIDYKDSVRNSASVTTGMDISAVMGGLVSFKASQSNEDNQAHGSGEVALEDSFNSDYDSDDVSQNDNATAMEKVSLFQEDDDSQYEDGEFRESVLHGWEEVEGEEGEAEHVDYGSDNIDSDAFEPAADYAVPVLLQVDSGGCKKETPSEVGQVCHEGKLDGERSEKGSICQPSQQGSLDSDVSRIDSGEKRAVTVVRKFSRGHRIKKDINEKLEMNVEVVSELCAGGDKVIGDEEFGSREPRRSTMLRTKSTGWDRLPDVCRSSREAVMDARDSGIVRNRIVSHTDSSNAEELRRVFRSTTNRELSSRIEGPKCPDASFRKDKVYADGSRSNNLDVNLRIERDAAGLVKSSGRVGSFVHMRGRGRAGDWLESSGWGRNRHNSPGYHGPGDHGLPGPKNAAAVAAAKLESNGFVVTHDGTIVRAGGVAPDGRVRRRSANSPTQNVHRSFTRRGSPTERDEALGFVIPLGLGQLRETSPGRSISGGRGRGRSNRYDPRVLGTSQRERYIGPVYNDDIDSSLPMQHPPARRQRSFSPIPRRVIHRSRSRTKSPSRSRTRSPSMWTSPRGRSSSGINRGTGLRQQISRSPNFRTDVRAERMRSPHRQLGFPEQMVDFVPAPRKHDSPPHASRWIDDRRGDAPAHFREHDYKRSSISERGPPERGFSRNHRFELMDSPGRMKPDENFRSMHSGRFSEFVGVVRRRSRHDVSDEDRQKHSERYGMVHSIRHYDNDGDVKGFRYDAVEDGFGAHQSRTKNASEFLGRGNPRGYGRGIESRLGSAPKSEREGRSHFRYDRDGKHNANFKTFGIRECDEDAEARRRRPS